MSSREYKPTASQKQAMELNNKTILVAAGAGSGKTSVLTKRVIKKISEGESIDRFLIVTFTDASASDVKSKLSAELEELSEKNDGSVTEAQKLHFIRQRHLIADANICTISSYCLSLVRENFQLLGLSPKLSMIDDTEQGMYMRRVIDGVITELYRQEEAWFLELSENFSDFRNDDLLIEEMLELYRSLRVTENWQEMLCLCASKLESCVEQIRKNGYFSTEHGKGIYTEISKTLKNHLDALRELTVFAAANTDHDKYVAPVAALEKACERILEGANKSYMDFAESAFEYLRDIPDHVSYKNDKFVNEYIKNEKNSILKSLRKLRDTYGCFSDEMIARDAQKSASLVRGICRLLVMFESAYAAEKIKNGLLDFADFESMALSLLQNPDGSRSDICKEKMQGISEIFIDEYQDVNPLQDKIFSLLSNGRNRFMVGDIKQSIYRFRNAYPDIFVGYKESFPDARDDDEPTGRIFLKENFRCSDSIIRFVNLVFQRITKGTRYFAEYDKEWLVHASVAHEVPRPVVIAVSPADNSKGRKSRAKQNEADYVAREIKRLVETEISDDGSRYRYSDFAVMFSAMKKYSIEFEKAFTLHGIPFKKEKTEDFLGNPAIMLTLAAMRAVDNPTDDISFCAALRSPIFDFSSDELYRIRRFSDVESMYLASKRFLLPQKAVRYSARYQLKHTKKTATLRAKCRRMHSRLKQWRELSTGTPCDEFLRSFFVSSGLIHTCINSGDRNSLLLMYELAVKYEKSAFHGLSGFLEYIAELEKNGKEISDAAIVKSEDAVSMITVHKSKGLEFKVCFVVAAEKEFNKGHKSKKIIFNRGKGIFFPLTDKEKLTKTDTVFQLAAELDEKKENLGEELRKLYVALTRAKERLYITGLCDVDCFEKEYSFESCNSWIKLLLCACREENTVFDRRYIPEKEDDSDGYIKKYKEPPLFINKKHLETAAYVYPHLRETSVPKKISVSELRAGLLEDDEYDRSIRLSVPLSRVSKAPSFAAGEKRSYSEIGTANHLFMQFCDFENVENRGTVCEAKRLLNCGIIDEKQYDMLDFSSLDRFFKGSLYKEISRSECVYREKRFSVLDSDVFSDSSEPVLVQGVIDCFFKNPDGTYTVVDYKTDRVDSDLELAKRHKVQLTCYCRAVAAMTGGAVSRALLYSFCLGREVEVL